MTVQYDGTDYHGWQEQRLPRGERGEKDTRCRFPEGPEGGGAETTPGLFFASATPILSREGRGGSTAEAAAGQAVRTVQGTLVEVLAAILGDRPRVEGAGRTDAGVHALGQVAAFDAARDIPLDRLQAALNSRLPADIAVADLAEVPPTFRPAADAVSKHYRYRLHVGRTKPVLEARYVWHWYRPIGVGPMQEAARLLAGRHDFASFQSRGGEREDTVRELHRLEVAERGQEVHFDVEGDRFLYRMVRNLVGTLVEVGSGHRPPAWVEAALEARDRRAAGPCAPPQGLCLMAVRY
jgi:tRNA pseudouridine38-40 synthase